MNRLPVTTRERAFESARIDYLQGRFALAAQKWQLGLAQAPRVQAPFYQTCLGLVALAQGDTASAAKLFEQALSGGGLNPSENDFLKSLGQPSP